VPKHPGRPAISLKTVELGNSFSDSLGMRSRQLGGAKMWMVRNNGGDYAEDFIDQAIVAIGWQAIGSLQNLKSRKDIIARVQSTWPEYKPMKAVVSGSQLDKIANVMKVGDRVLTYDPAKRVYHIGVVKGPYAFDGTVAESLAHRRQVDWLNKVERDRLSVPTKNSLGSTLTVFQVPAEAEAELDSIINGASASHQSLADRILEIPLSPIWLRSEEAVDEQVLLDDYTSKAREFIKDKIIKLDWADMQRLVAGLLRAMGYKTQISPEGPDRGKDIVASPDGLGLEQPRIVVEVKHRPSQSMSAPEIRSYLGGRHKDDRGLYVSTGGFTKDARYEADRASIPLTLIDIDTLVGLVVENYEQLDLASRTLLPLTKVYWPS
jgi:restriction system protein